jgi:hypothetical protein
MRCPLAIQQAYQLDVDGELRDNIRDHVLTLAFMLPWQTLMAGGANTSCLFITAGVVRLCSSALYEVHALRVPLHVIHIIKGMRYEQCECDFQDATYMAL